MASPSKPELPHRILELYLRIHALCWESDDESASQQKVKEMFERNDLICHGSNWTTPTRCILDVGIWPELSKIKILPSPDDWEATTVESEKLREFYSQTLEIKETCSGTDVVAALDHMRALAPEDLMHQREKIRGLFFAIQNAAPQLSASEFITLK
ncbi:hypothetical protein G7Z17_g1026 [Cylindrodendrum hubeiense]|uniref:Uncharacterized protein n=1 Tax=Cylindrodendrum hubeiense TaxID=595255 RepID=A0A9P5LCU2_9HYPO|nr:hypothetical protein G7Z17_g1026 [Cylindrodendrum hubeiense]